MAKKKKSKAGDLRRKVDYYDHDTLENWQRIVKDLGIRGSYVSKTQCKRVIKTVWVSIADFIESVNNGTRVRKFKNRHELVDYMDAYGCYYPRSNIVRGSPLASLLKELV